MLDEFRRIVESCQLHAPMRPYISNVTGSWITPAQATDPAYYVEHVRCAVLFGEGVRTVTAGPRTAWLEVGPGHALSSIVRKQLSPGERIVVSSLGSTGGDATDSEQLLDATAQLWLAGVGVNWSAIDNGGRNHPLPTYPFERRRHWVDVDPAVQGEPVDDDDVSEAENDVGDLGDDTTDKERSPQCAAFTWTRHSHLDVAGIVPVLPTDDRGDTCWLVVGDEHELSRAVLTALAAAERRVAWIRFGDTWQCDGPLTFVVRPDHAGDYDLAIRALATESLVPRRVLHLG